MKNFWSEIGKPDQGLNCEIITFWTETFNIKYKSLLLAEGHSIP